ncbi:MAG: phytanoyl-CoA dioxygenase family protein [Pseudomonadota bacterium]
MHERTRFDQDGRLWLRQVVSGSGIQALKHLMGLDGRPGARVAPEDALFQAVKAQQVSHQIAGLWPGMKPVRIVSFDKSSASNWKVSWHQDRVIAVKARADVPAFSNWSQKNDVWHCEPPLEILQEMLFVRLHLDPSTPETGAMEIAVGSHKAGLVRREHAKAVAQEYQTEMTEAAPGDVLILPMLALHKSDRAVRPDSRAVLRIDFAPENLLPAPLAWSV